MLPLPGRQSCHGSLLGPYCCTGHVVSPGSSIAVRKTACRAQLPALATKCCHSAESVLFPASVPASMARSGSPHSMPPLAPSLQRQSMFVCTHTIHVPTAEHPVMSLPEHTDWYTPLMAACGAVLPACCSLTPHVMPAHCLQAGTLMGDIAGTFACYTIWRCPL